MKSLKLNLRQGPLHLSNSSYKIQDVLVRTTTKLLIGPKSNYETGKWTLDTALSNTGSF